MAPGMGYVLNQWWLLSLLGVVTLSNHTARCEPIPSITWAFPTLTASRPESDLNCIGEMGLESDLPLLVPKVTGLSLSLWGFSQVICDVV